MKIEELAGQSCRPRKGAADALATADRDAGLKSLPGWQPTADGHAITKDFRFPDFHHTLGFINAVGFMANREDHHPDIEAGYGHCRLTWSTHDVGGLSMNDLICAAKVEALLVG